ncbi:MAG: hypothetical protein EXQ85_10235 [Alphaproteobacteria bacterium]|nr:hypothetical protein [Alphaproteobacteria bacterium]
MLETEKWYGASGRGWVFTVSALPCAVEPAGRNGNFVFCRRDGNRWRAIYIGEGELETTVATLQRDSCVAGKGATHVHWRFTGGGPPMRGEIDADLRAGNAECRAPSGCNQE